MKFTVAFLSVLVVLTIGKEWKRPSPRLESMMEKWKSPLPRLEPLIKYNRTGRIVGGDEAEPNSWKHQVALYIDNKWFCGGSLISEDWVLTAAHCVYGAKEVKVIAGAHDLRVPESTQQTEMSDQIIWHEYYNYPYFLANDIALVHLKCRFQFDAYVNKISYNRGSDPGTGSRVTATGWGKPSDSSSGISPVLMQVEVPVISNAACAAVYGNIVQSYFICVATTDSKGTCNGDSGGPLFFDGMTIAVTSFGAGAGCEAGYPAGLTRTSNYADWIKDHSGVEGV